MAGKLCVSSGAAARVTCPSGLLHPPPPPDGDAPPLLSSINEGRVAFMTVGKEGTYGRTGFHPVAVEFWRQRRHKSTVRWLKANVPVPWCRSHSNGSRFQASYHVVKREL